MKATGSNVSRVACLAFLALALSIGAAPAQAQMDRTEREYRIQEEAAGTRLRFDADPALSNFTLSVTGPQGYNGQVTSARCPAQLSPGRPWASP